MTLCGTRDNSLRERVLRECDLPMSKAISAGHAADETRKHAFQILLSQPRADIGKIFKRKLNKSSHNIRNQNTRNFIKKCKFCDSSLSWGKCPGYGKVCYVCNKKNHFKVFCPHVGKRVQEIEIWKGWMWWTLRPDLLWIFIKTINIHNSIHLKQIRTENSEWSITFALNGIHVSCKITTGAQCNVIPLTVLKKFDPEPKLCPLNINLSAYNNSKIPVLGKCSDTLKHKKDHFDISFPVIDSKFVPFLGLANS